MKKSIMWLAAAGVLASGVSLGAGMMLSSNAKAHGGGLNRCGCHFNRRTGECHCHRNRGCGCECEPPSCR